jgi:hypothetical protein
MVETHSSKAFSCRKAAQFFIAIIITLIIGKAVANIPLFSNTELFRTLTSAELVSFVTKMAVLVFVFIFTKHAINALDGTGGGVSFLRGIAVPLASLIIVAVAQESVREILNPFLGSTGNTLLIMLSSLIVFAAALWVIFAGYQHSPLLFDFFVSIGRMVRSRTAGNPVSRTCFNCGYPIDGLVKYCPACGIELETRRCKKCNSVLNPSGKYCGQCGYLQEDQG